jgi:hypothetical protein
VVGLDTWRFLHPENIPEMKTLKMKALEAVSKRHSLPVAAQSDFSNGFYGSSHGLISGVQHSDHTTAR